jgi:hypothetical protein
MPHAPVGTKKGIKMEVDVKNILEEGHYLEIIRKKKNK